MSTPPACKFKPGEKVDVVDLRDGTIIEIEATAGDAVFEQPPGYPAPQWFVSVEARSGLKFSCAERCLLPAKEGRE